MCLPRNTLILYGCAKNQAPNSAETVDSHRRHGYLRTSSDFTCWNAGCINYARARKKFCYAWKPSCAVFGPKPPFARAENKSWSMYDLPQPNKNSTEMWWWKFSKSPNYYSLKVQQTKHRHIFHCEFLTVHDLILILIYLWYVPYCGNQTNCIIESCGMVCLYQITPKTTPFYCVCPKHATLEKIQVFGNTFQFEFGRGAHSNSNSFDPTCLHESQTNVDMKIV